MLSEVSATDRRETGKRARAESGEYSEPNNKRLTLLPSSSLSSDGSRQTEPLGLGIMLGGRSRSTSHGLVPGSDAHAERHAGLPLNVGRDRSNSVARSRSGSISLARARSGSISSVRARAVPRPRPRSSSTASSVMMPSAGAAGGAGLGMMPSLGGAGGSSIGHGGMAVSMTAAGPGVLLGGGIASADLAVPEVSKMRMKDFLRNRPNSKRTPSGERRRDAQKKKQEDRRRLRKLGIELPKEDEAAKRKKRKEKAEAAAKTRANIFSDESEATPLAPRVIFKDGKMVVDTSSLVYKAQNVPIPEIDMPMQDDEDRTHVTSMSYSKRKGAARWSEEETKLFYFALRQCGQDFTMVAQFFPERDRRQIAKKYKREEREHPDLVERALNKGASLPLKLDAFADAALVEQFRAFDQAHRDLGKEPATSLEEAISLPVPIPDKPEAPTPPQDEAERAAASGEPRGQGAPDGGQRPAAALSLEQMIQLKLKETAQAGEAGALGVDAIEPATVAAGQQEGEEEEDDEDDEEDEDEDEEEDEGNNAFNGQDDEYFSGEEL